MARVCALSMRLLQARLLRERPERPGFQRHKGLASLRSSSLAAAIVLLVTIATLPLYAACGPGDPAPIPTATPGKPTASPTDTAEPTATPTQSREDLYEPNDSMIRAFGPLVPGQEYQAYVSAKDDVDYFYLEIETPQTVKITLTDIPPERDYDLYLITGEEDILSSSASSGQEEERIVYTTSSVGVFYVLVLPFHDFSEVTPYTLQLELSPAPTPSGEDRYEPNDTFEQATGPLAFAQTYESYIWDEGDIDTYLFQLASSGTIAVDLTEIPAIADYDLFLYEGTGHLLNSSTRVVDHEHIEQELEPGTYYVTVQSFAGFSRNESYALKVVVVEP